MTPAPAPTASVDVALAHASRLLATDPELAGEQAREILRSVSGHPSALLVLGASHNARGQAERAHEILAPLARSQPGSAQAHCELGIALGAMGRGAEAIAALRQAVALKPTLARAWLALADHLEGQGDTEGARTARARHLRHSMQDPALLQAADALQANRLPEAARRLDEILRREPNNPAALRMRAECAARMGRTEEAEALLERCLALSPGFDAARLHYAMVLHRANKPAEALVEVDRLLQRAPGNPAYRNLKAVVLCRTCDYDAAIVLYEGIVAAYPEQPRLWLSFGHALKTAGHTARAIEAYRKAVALDPAYGEAWWSLANLKTFRFQDADVAAMQREAARARLDDEQRLQLDFALGKALEDRQAWADAFAAYARGNALRLAHVPYSPDAMHARLRRTREACDARFFEERQGWGCPAPDPIFIVGMPRAGSTLVEQILASHPLVEGTMELPEITSIVRALRLQSDEAASYHDVLATLGADAVRAIGEQYIERTRIHRKAGAPFFIDKMPNNFAHVGLIRLALPNAKVIDARRHPLACGFSLFKQHFARGQDFSYDLVHIGRYYRDYVALMAHFDDVLPGYVHRVAYERMVEDTETEVRRLLAHCGLPFDAACLRFFENDRPVRTASSEQVRQPIYREGMDHWRHFEPWLGPLEGALGPVLAAYPAVPATSASDLH